MLGLWILRRNRESVTKLGRRTEWLPGFLGLLRSFILGLAIGDCSVQKRIWDHEQGLKNQDFVKKFTKAACC
jgi:hypothetical protein